GRHHSAVVVALGNIVGAPRNGRERAVVGIDGPTPDRDLFVVIVVDVDILAGEIGRDPVDSAGSGRRRSFGKSAAGTIDFVGAHRVGNAITNEHEIAVGRDGDVGRHGSIQREGRARHGPEVSIRLVDLVGVNSGRGGS